MILMAACSSSLIKVTCINAKLEVDSDNHHVFRDIFNRAGYSNTSSASARYSAAFCLYAPPGTASGQDGIRATDD